MRYLLTGFLVSIIAMSASAQPRDGTSSPRGKQPPRTGYVIFDFDPNVENMVKDRLKLERDLGPFKDLVKQMLADPEKFALDPEKLKGAKLDDPAMANAVRNWLKQDPQLKKAVENWIRNQPADKVQGSAAQLQQDLQKLVANAPPASPDLEDSGASKRWARSDGPTKQHFDPVATATERAMQQAQEGGIGEWLSDSPGWKRAFEDLQISIRYPDGAGWQMGDWQKRLGFDEQKAQQFGENALNRLRDLPHPNFEGPHWDRALSGVRGIPRSNFGPPGMPTYSRRSMPSASTWAIGFVILAVMLFFGWQVQRRLKRTALVADERAMLGPWPIEPSAVSTRSELVRAFDYLALRTLGLRITSWNHQAVARRWSEHTPSLASMAQDLAAIYEASRYTDGVETLTPPQRDQARHALTQLAEALP